MPQQRKNKFLVFIVCTLLFSCSKKPYFEEYIKVDSTGWHTDSVGSFTIDIQDTNSSYIVYFNLRANDSYGYSNLYLFREIIREDHLEYRDTAQLTLADEYGKWLGKGIGELKTFSRIYRAQPLRFNAKGTYTFTFEQAMRDELLMGIEDIGLTLYREENGKEKD